MLPSLAFVPEMKVVDCFYLLMQVFPENACNLAKYFEDNYIGKKLQKVFNKFACKECVKISGFNCIVEISLLLINEISIG